MPGFSITEYALWFVILLVYVGIPLMVLKLLFQAARGRRDSSGTILRERFAKGEISQAEYEDAKRILGS
jgi:uncharacterized membrane protein